MPNQCDDRKANENYKETRGGRDQKRERERVRDTRLDSVVSNFRKKTLSIGACFWKIAHAFAAHNFIHTLTPSTHILILTHMILHTHTNQHTRAHTPTPTHKQLHKLAHMLSIQAIGSHTLTHAPTPTHTPKYTSPCTHMHACTLSRQRNHTHTVSFIFDLLSFFFESIFATVEVKTAFSRRDLVPSKPHRRCCMLGWLSAARSTADETMEPAEVKAQTNKLLLGFVFLVTKARKKVK